ncbi:hypothetical protein EGY07_06055 [Chryseobacterium indologenes]|uniref:Uncharacterized protein n=1 Tax=Chryseobacterium oryzae TaxID=2929799 RepID=A0ABY4BE98_9FLAO|nr:MULTISPECIES: hypothetical protein [Chryseobacterium]UEQ78089.1 hypothetical protein J8N07_07255 [Chryseobacterium arthrosphaerae]AYZ35163.1 hypothetical protein EGY07_06055 [Chryseobacterium indologenes]MEB4762904.1 hypothetical protein [Chryseobacterium indologenes]OCK50407.1 hypothetical protein BA768_19835 [Chryseobacterium sp. CBo1]UOE37493.1 hypothetical protein MTP08_10485 [Chryseobacterium oryzae]
MKNTLLIITIILSGLANSQVIIGDAVGTAPAGQKTSVLLEFAAGQNKGIILPYVRTIPAGTGLAEGTIILDATNPAGARVRYYNGVTTNGATGWVDLSNGNNGNITSVMALQPTSAQVNEDANAKVIIGSDTSSAAGVLVLESSSKAMILPIVSDTNSIPDPAPGMMVFINKTGAKRLAVYNGSGWTYWKP